MVNPVQLQNLSASQQQAILNNPNLLRKSGLGYLLAPAFKEQRLQAISNANILQQQQTQQQVQLQQNYSPNENEYINRLVRNRPLNPEFFSLPKKEQQRLIDIAEGIQATQIRNQARGAVAEAKSAILKIDPNAKFGLDFERAVTNEFIKNYDITAGRSGKLGITITSEIPAPVTTSDFKYMSEAPPRQAVDPYAFTKSGIYEVFRGEKLAPTRNILSGRAFSEAQARSQGYVKGTPEYENAVESSQLGQELFSAVVGSIAGVPKVSNVVKVPLREVDIPTFIEVQQPVVSGGKVKTYSSYEIFAERTPPTAILDSTKAGGFLGTDPYVDIIPSKFDIISTVKPIEERGRVVTLATRTGKTFMLDTLTGNAKLINIENIDQFSNINKFLLQRLAEDKIGKPISNLYYFDQEAGILGRSPKAENVNAKILDQIKNILGKYEDINLGTIIRENPGAIPKARGKSITRFSTVSRTKSLVDTDEFELFETKILFKDITNDLSRASGKTPSMKGVIKVFKEPIVLDEDITNFVKFKGSKKTPFSKTFGLQEELTQILETPKPIPKTPRIPKAKVISMGETSRIGGTSSLLSRGFNGNAYGTGSDYIFDFSRGFQDFSKRQTSGQNFNQRPSSINKLIPLSLSKDIQINILSPKGITKNIPREVPREIAREISKELQKEIQKQTQRQIPRFAPKQSSKEENIKPYFYFERSPRYSRPKVIGRGSRRYVRGRTSIPSYSVFLKRRGQFIPVATDLPRGIALKFGSDIALNELARTFKVIQTGTTDVEDIAFRPSRDIFREYKIRKGQRQNVIDTFIQKTSANLQNQIEKQLIQRARKRI